MEHAMVNCSGKIRLFWDAEWEGEVVSDTIQQLTLRFKHQNNHKEVLITAIYARCSAIERLELWEDLA